MYILEKDSKSGQSIAGGLKNSPHARICIHETSELWIILCGWSKKLLAKIWAYKLWHGSSEVGIRHLLHDRIGVHSSHSPQIPHARWKASSKCVAT